MHKKGTDFGFPVYFLPSLVLFILTIVIFSIIFFGIGIANPPNLVINSESFQDNSKVLEIVRFTTQVQQNGKNLSIVELISLAKQDETYSPILTKELKLILEKLPKPAAKDAFWSLNIKIQDQEFISVGSEVIGGKNYFNQKLKIPLASKEIAELNLQLSCSGCTKEEVKEYG